jgi:hypothetical protein
MRNRVKTDVCLLRRCLAVLFATAGLLLMSTSLFAQHTYYISKSAGSDSNTATQAQSKSTPWAHLPGMRSCISNCGSYNPVAGDHFVLRGGDHWVASDLPVTFTSNGTSGSPIYIGVDQTWFTGASWTRPIFDCQSTNCNPYNGMIEIGGSYVTVDNIEITGIRFTVAGGTMKGVQTTADHTIVENCYFHGWSHDASFSNSNDDGRGFAMAANTSGGGNAGVGVVFHDNVVDGQDTSRDMMGGADDSETVYNNIFRYVYNCVRGIHTYVYSNLCEYIVIEGWPNADHANGISIFSQFAGTSMWVYNNVVRHTTASAVGSETMWLHSLGDATGNTTYVYNNILYDNGRGIDIGDHPPASSGTSYFYNNTVEGGGNHCFGNGESSPRGTLNYENDHCINVGVTCDSTGVTCSNLGGTLTQTTAQADANTSPHFDQYTASETDAYSPVASTTSTVGAGINLTSSCAGSLAALCSSTTYPEYDAVNHKVVFTSATSRPASGAWDSGAYEYAPGGCGITPTNVGPYTAGESISQPLTASGCGASTFTMTSGSLSGSGLTLSSGGTLSGTAQAGSFSFTVAYSTATVPITLTINSASVMVNPPTSLSLTVR